jgi:hypothetical protein
MKRARDGKPYANAREVLPGWLVREIQGRFAGGFLWVPVLERRRVKTRGHDRRNRRIAAERSRGLSLKELARKFGLSEERVRQILAGSKS